MKTPLAGNLVATATQKEALFQPAIDDGEALFVFDAYNYSGKANAVAHAQKTIDMLQTSVNGIVASWHVTVKGK